MSDLTRLLCVLAQTLYNQFALQLRHEGSRVQISTIAYHFTYDHNKAKKTYVACGIDAREYKRETEMIFSNLI